VNRFQAIDPEMLGLRPGDRVLDVGCGIGRHILELSRCPGLYIGLDAAREDLRKGAYWFLLMSRKGEPQGAVYFTQGDASRLPFAEGQFLEATLFGLLASTEDMKEGMAAFLEKRASAFKGS